MKKIIVLMTLLVSMIAFGEPVIPETQVGKIFSDWLTAFNAADQDKLLAFRQTYNPWWTLDQALGFRQQTGGFELVDIGKNQPLSLVVVVKDKNAQKTFKLSLSLNSAEPPFNLDMPIQPIEQPADEVVSRLSQADALTALIQHVDALAKEDKFAGALLIARQGKILLKKSWGYANRELKTPNTLNTQFRLGSMNKMFTSVAILQLVDAGKLSLDDVIGKYMPDYPNKDIATKVTVGHLLSHTGGTGDMFGAEFFANRLELKAHQDYVDLFGSRGLDHEPGSKFNYSNYGYVLLGALIERVSGVSYYSYVEGHIFKPCGMTSTASLPESEYVKNRAGGYMKQKGEWISNADTLPYRGMAAGGGYSTVGDLFRFATALESGKLVSKHLLDEAITPHFKNGSFGYGYGFEVWNEGTLLSFGHSGGAPGMNGDLFIYPKLRGVVVSLSNLDPPAADDLVKYYSNRMPDK